MIQTAGSLGIIFGCATWAIRLFDRPERADDKRASLEDKVEELRSRLKTLNRQLQEATTTDSLTGTLNRRTFLQRVDETIRRDIRLGKPFAFLLVDIVGFRALNGRMGKLAGDHVLQHVGQALRSLTRGTDFVGRLGGDEFGIMLAECDDSQPAITRILLALEEASVPDDDGRDGRRTIPIAVHVGCVEVPNAVWCRGFGQLFLLAEERVRSLRDIPKSHMSKIKLESHADDDAATG
jgi:diguanylate cyclase (GGDEF)-like protein